MKKAIFAVAMFVLPLGTAVAAQEVPAQCYRNAETYLETAELYRGYDENGFEAYECNFAPNQKAVICDVMAYKGGGDAIDTYRVVMSRTCDKVFRIELTGEE